MGVSQNTQKWILAFFMFFNGVVTPGGIIYGWPGLSQQLKNSAQYADGCGPNYSPKETCPSQDNHLNNIFAVGANIATLSTIVYGFTLDRFGVRANAFSGALIMAAGFVLLALSDSGKMDAFIPGFAMVAFGGLGTYLPAFQFSALFSRPTLILSVQSALFGVAGLTFTFLKYLDESHGITRKTSFLFYAGLVLFCGINMLLLYPANAYRKGDTIHLPVLGWLGIQKAPQEGLDAAVNGFGTEKIDADYSPLTDEDSSAVTKKLEVFAGDSGYGADQRGSPTSDVEATNGNTLAPSAGEIAMLRAERKVRDLTHVEKEAVKNARTLKEELLDPGTILVALHFSIGLLCCNMYNANISSVLKNMGDSDGKITNAFVFITSIYPCVFALAIDTLQRKYRYAGTSFLATLFLIVGFSFGFIHNIYAQIPAFFIFGTGRALLITVMFSFVAVEYRGDHYGRVIAFVTTICAAIGLLQLALQKVLNGPADNNFDYFTIGFIVALAPLFYFSWWCHKGRV